MAAKKYDMTILGRPTTVANYSLKAECYGFALRQYKDNWPFLTHVKGTKATADFAAWDHYFHTFLRGFPACYKMFREWKLEHYNVPEERPELFDTAYMPPTHKLVEPLPPFHHVEPETDQQRTEVTERIVRVLREALEDHSQEFPNVFVPKDNERYPAIIERCEREPHPWHDGVSMLDLQRRGVWVPSRWLTEAKTTIPGGRRQAFTRYTDEQLLETYGKR